MTETRSNRQRTLAGTVLSVLSVFSALSFLTALPAHAQTDPRLVGVIRQAQEGRGDSARTKVQRLLAATSPTDTLYPQIIYTQAMVASDANEMRRQLQRVAVEYSSSSWADDALLRLVQLDYASGNLQGAARNLERIRSDYPGSSLLPQAAYWAARTYFDQKSPEPACRWITDGLAASRGNVELENQLGYLNQRCSNVRVETATGTVADSQTTLAARGSDTTSGSTKPADSTLTSTAASPVPANPVPATPPPPSPRPTAARPDSTRLTKPSVAPQPRSPGGRFHIQITAVRVRSTAESTAAKLKARGFEPVIVQEAGLYKVRMGNYSSRPDAIAALPDIKAKLGGSPFVVAEP